MAVKRFHYPKDIYIEREVKMLQLAQHTNVVKFLAFEATVSWPYDKVMITELCQLGSLQNLIEKHPNGLSVEDFRILCNDLASAVGNLHALNIIHRDIKPANVLISMNDGQKIFKLADFGFARILEPNQTYNSLCGTFYFIHPEVFQRFFLWMHQTTPNRIHNFKAEFELWAIGVTMYFAFTGHLPFMPKDEEETDSRLWFKMIAEKPKGCITAKETDSHNIQWGDSLGPQCTTDNRTKEILRTFFLNLIDVSILTIQR